MATPTRWLLLHADSLELLPELPENSVEAIITDPPYGIGFGGEAWDGGTLTDAATFQRWTSAWAAEALRVLKPGGWLAAFGTPRTAHRLVAGVEDAGFEVRDQLLWLYAQGVPKSHRRVDGLGSTLKPAYEPILLARKPMTGTLDANLAEHGTGALQIDAGACPAPCGWTGVLAGERHAHARLALPARALPGGLPGRADRHRAASWAGGQSPVLRIEGQPPGARGWL